MTLWLSAAAVDEAEARVDAVRTARLRSANLFALNAPADVAKRRTQAFDAMAKQWLHRTQTAEERMTTASAARAFVAASVYAASGNSLVAPLVAGAFGASKTVVAVLVGRG